MFQRVMATILPATGPVGVMGDLGRDFETFRAFVGKTASRFCGITETKLLFACLFIQDVSPKIGADAVQTMQE
jgi:hypothetical protein